MGERTTYCSAMVTGQRTLLQTEFCCNDGFTLCEQAVIWREVVINKQWRRLQLQHLIYNEYCTNREHNVVRNLEIDFCEVFVHRIQWPFHLGLP